LYLDLSLFECASQRQRDDGSASPKAHSCDGHHIVTADDSLEWARGLSKAIDVREHWREATMLANRTSLLTLAFITPFALAAGSTAAEARFFGSPFCHGSGSPVRSYIAATQSRGASKIASVRQKDKDDEPAKPVSRPRPVAEPVKPAASAASATLASATSVPVQPVATAPAANAAASTSTCLTKEYLDTGAVSFTDTCTNEWAVNSTEVDNKSPVVRTCLTKDNQNGVVMFKDVCTGEWAMNTSTQPARIQAAQVR
jgi:hypothetical protein